MQCHICFSLVLVIVLLTVVATTIEAFSCSGGVVRSVHKQHRHKSKYSHNIRHHHTSLSLSSTSTLSIPQISSSDIDTLSTKGYVIIPNFLSQSLVDELRQDITTLRSNNAFRQAKIGQDSTNELNTNIRIAETCFLGRNRNELTSIIAAGGSNSVRDRSSGLYDILDGICDSLQSIDTSTRLDKSLNELLYAYYPEGGYYRRHRDAVPSKSYMCIVYCCLLFDVCI